MRYEYEGGSRIGCPPFIQTDMVHPIVMLNF